MEIKQLEAFIVLASELHYGRAAERLHIGTPSLSKIVSALERELGVVLVVRGPRGAYLPPAGIALAEEANALLAQVDRLRNSLREGRESTTDEFRIGVSATLGDGALAKLVAWLHLRWPSTWLNVRIANPAVLVTELLARRLDLVLSHDRNVVPGVDSTFLRMEPLALAVPTGHPLANENSVDAASFLAYPLVLPAEDAAGELRAATERLASRARKRIRGGAEANGLRAMLALVAAGYGAAVVPLPVGPKLRSNDIQYLPIASLPALPVLAKWRISDTSSLDLPTLVADLRLLLNSPTFWPVAHPVRG